MTDDDTAAEEADHQEMLAKCRYKLAHSFHLRLIDYYAEVAKVGSYTSLLQPDIIASTAVAHADALLRELGMLAEP